VFIGLVLHGGMSRIMPDLLGENGETTLIGGRYRIVSVLGGGAMGNVFLAQDESLKRQVAIKVLKDEWGGRADVVKRLENECRLMAHLGQHPNIVSLIDRLVVDGKTMLVMEYATGETLAQILSRTVQLHKAGGPATSSKPRDESLPLILTPDIAYEIVVQCLTALDYAHSKGVLHLDIKPGNIMIQRDRMGRVTAKLMDFGIGRTRVDSNLASAVTALTFTEGAGMGTPAYMAPEQIDPERFGTAGPTADLYSLGVTFFEMLTLQLPFSGAYTEVLHAHADTRPPNPREINPEIPVGITRVILTALRKAPGNRYHSAGEMLQELQRARLSQHHVEEALEAEEQIEEGPRARWWKSSSLFSLRAVTGVGVLLFVLLYWFLGWSLPFNLDGCLARLGGGMTVSEARGAAEMARSKAENARAKEYAPEAWNTAEDSFRKAAARESAGVDAVRLFLQAQINFDRAAELAVKVEGVAPSPVEGESAGSTQGDMISGEELERVEAEDSDADELEKMPLLPRNAFETGMMKTVNLGTDVDMELVWIRGGAFDFMDEAGVEDKRGSGTKPAKTDSRGIRVRLRQGFWIGRFEVTQKQWVAVMGNNPSKFQGDLNLPVDSVNWHDCQEFIRRLNEIVAGGGFRLPTEAEWEYAARAGGGISRRGFGMLEDLGDYAWYSGDSGGQTHPVGTKSPNDWGLYDTIGNVWEWVQDWDGQEFSKDKGPLTNPVGPTSGVYKLLRGGAWSFYQDQCKVTARNPVEPGQSADTYGFRIARDFVPE